MGRLHVKKNDLVVVLWGAEKGKVGKVLSADAHKGRVLVEGVNIIKKAIRKSEDKPKGGIVSKEGSIAASKVMLQERFDARQKKRNGAASSTTESKSKSKE